MFQTTNDFIDEFEESSAYDYSNSATKIVSTPVRINAMLALALETPEIIATANNSKDITDQLAGTIGAVIGGYLVAQIGFLAAPARAGSMGLIGWPATLAPTSENVIILKRPYQIIVDRYSVFPGISPQLPGRSLVA